jgi:hypothetical protein
MTEWLEHEFSDGSSMQIISYPLDKSSSPHFQKQVDADLGNILLDPENYKDLHIGTDDINKIFLGFASAQPTTTTQRFPVWIPSKFLSSHVLIGGSIGSGKTSLTYRLIAGALKTFGTVVIGEAKGGKKGYEKGAAFTGFVQFLTKQLQVQAYRWPRGNCWFNPLLYLNTEQERKQFLLGLSEQIKVGDNGELQAYIRRAANIATLVLEFLVTIALEEKGKRESCTIKNLVYLLKNPDKTQQLIQQLSSVTNKEIKTKVEEIKTKVEEIKRELEKLNFFALQSQTGRDKFLMTASGLNYFIDFIDDDDLLYYSEYHEKGQDGEPLQELKIDELLYQRSLVVISQPLDNPNSSVIGPLFWDALLNQVLELGPNPEKRNGKNREKVAVFLDETHRLPVGRLGNAGDFLRQYNLALIEITPTIVDKERWEHNKHVYQTIISLSPGIDEVIRLLYDRLLNQQQEIFRLALERTSEGSLTITPKFNEQLFQSGQDNPGVSLRSLRDTGKYTALLHSNLIRNALGLFWIDLESNLMAEFDTLLEDANNGDEVAIKLVNYTLGLVKEFCV